MSKVLWLGGPVIVWCKRGNIRIGWVNFQIPKIERFMVFFGRRIMFNVQGTVDIEDIEDMSRSRPDVGRYSPGDILDMKRQAKRRDM